MPEVGLHHNNKPSGILRNRCIHLYLPCILNKANFLQEPIIEPIIKTLIPLALVAKKLLRPKILFVHDLFF